MNREIGSSSLEQTRAVSPAEREAASPLAAVRAFAVMLGGSLVLLGGAAYSVASAARALVRGKPPRPLARGGLAGIAAYVHLVRPWLLSWGATPEERSRPLPGDEPGNDPTSTTTRAVTIEASVDDVWPWLAQVGQDRGGFYSYEWLENLAGCRMRNADRIHPEWQHRSIGDKIYLHPALGVDVTDFEPNRVLGLKGWGSFVLERLPGNRTRLLARGRPTRGLGRLYNALLMEIPHFAMERKMLLGIKQRAERQRHATTAQAAAVGQAATNP